MLERGKNFSSNAENVNADWCVPSKKLSPSAGAAIRRTTPPAQKEHGRHPARLSLDAPKFLVDVLMSAVNPIRLLETKGSVHFPNQRVSRPQPESLPLVENNLVVRDGKGNLPTAHS